MGTSFANIHVFSRDRKTVEAALKRKGFFGSLFHSYYTGQFDDWISVLGSAFNWETIGEEAAQLSRRLADPVEAIGYFDDDVLLWTFYRNGEQVQGFTTGDIEQYEIEKEDFDFPALIELLHLPVTAEELEAIFDDESDLMSIVEQMEKLLKIPLWAKYDWVEDDEELRKGFQAVR